MRKTRQDADLTRDSLLDAAEQLFAEKGFAAATLQQVAEAAGVTRGAVYWHFTCKEAVFDAMLERAAVTLTEPVAVMGASDPLAILRQRIDAVFYYTVHDERFRRVLGILIHDPRHYRGLSPLFERGMAQREAAISEFAVLLQAAQEAGQLDARLDLRLCAQACHSFMSGVITDWLLVPDSFDLLMVGSQLTDALFEALRTSTSLRLRAAH